MRNPWAVGTALALASGYAWRTARALTYPKPSPYDYHMAYNESWYSGVLAGSIHDPFLPPLYVALGGLVPFLEPVHALRLISLASLAALVGVTYRRRGSKAAALVASLPWAFLWAGRAQTDALMAALAWGGILLQGRLGAFLSALSGFAKPVGVLSLLGHVKRQDWLKRALWALLGLIPILVWIFTRPAHVWAFHASSSVPFGNLAGNLFAVVFGGAATWSLLSRRVDWSIVAPAAAFAVFAFVKAPWGHEYYLLPALIGVCLLVDTKPLGWRATFSAVLVNLVVGVWLVSTLGA